MILEAVSSFANNSFTVQVTEEINSLTCCSVLQTDVTVLCRPRESSFADI